jgi:hypothetical protein
VPAPQAFQAYLGASFVKTYGEAALTIGDQTFTRYDVAHDIDCPVTKKAMGILTEALKKLGVRTVKQALDIHAVDLADLPGVGVTTIYLFLCWQRAQRSSDKAVAAWYGETVTFNTLKRRAEARKGREAPPRRRRTA